MSTERAPELSTRTARRDPQSLFGVAPLELPGPAWHGTSTGDAGELTDNGNFFRYIEAVGAGSDATLDISLRYGDGEIAWETQLSANTD